MSVARHEHADDLLCSAPAVAASANCCVFAADARPVGLWRRFDHAGLNVTGSLRLSQNNIADVPATLTGTLAGTSFPTTMQYTVTYEFGPFSCRGTFSGTSNVTLLEIGGVFSGQNCVRMFTGTLSATRRD